MTSNYELYQNGIKVSMNELDLAIACDDNSLVLIVKTKTEYKKFKEVE